MIYRIVKLTFKEEEITRFFTIFDSKKNVIADAKGCVSMSILQDPSDPKLVFTFSTWESICDLETYRLSSEFKELWSAIKPLFLLPAEAWSLNSRFDYLEVVEK